MDGLPETLLLLLPEGTREGLDRREADSAALREPLLLLLAKPALPLTVALAAPLGVREALEEPVKLGLLLLESVKPRDRLPLSCVMLGRVEREGALPVGSPVKLAVVVRLPVEEGEGVRLPLPVALLLGRAEREVEGHLLPAGVAEGQRVVERVGEGVRLWLPVTVRDTAPLLLPPPLPPERLPVGVLEAHTETDKEALPEVEGQALEEREALGDTVCVPPPLPLPRAVPVGGRVLVGVPAREGVARAV